MMSLKAWAFRNRHRKAYVYDEAIASTPSRRAMSKLNTEWLKFIPQLSKAKLHLIVVTQETEFTEGSFLHETFIRGLWKKIAFPKGHPQYRKMVKLYSTLLPEIPVFRSVPRCLTKFDPFKTATFMLEPESPDASIPDDVAIAIDYGSGIASSGILKKYTWIKTRKQVMDHVRGGSMP